MIRATRTPGGHRRIPVEEVQRLLGAGSVRLRPYQEQNAADLLRLLVQGAKAIAYSAPPGAGKTLVLSVVAGEALCAEGWDRVLVATPFRSIRNAFEGAARVGEIRGWGRRIPVAGLWPRFRGVEAWDAFWTSPRPQTAVATNSAWVRVQKALLAGELEWPPRSVVERTLLILDEGHHAGGEPGRDEDRGARNVIAAFAEALAARGGTVVYASATIHRGDGWIAVPPDAPWVVRSLGAHARDGYAPQHWLLDNIVTAPSRSVSRQEDMARAMVGHWLELGRPKTIVHFPGKGPKAFAEAAEAAFAAVGARVLNAVGDSDAIRDRFEKALEDERQVRRYVDSKVDVILSCVRMREGADWPLASVVFCAGAPTTLPSLLQIVGRAMRDKRQILGYPEAWVDRVQIVTFLPGALTGYGDQDEAAPVGVMHQNSLEVAGLFVLLAEDAAVGRELNDLLRRRAWGLAGRKAVEDLLPDVEPELTAKSLQALDAAVQAIGFTPPGEQASEDPGTWPRAPYTVGGLLDVVLAEAAARGFTVEEQRVLLGHLVAHLIVTDPDMAEQVVRRLAVARGEPEPSPGSRAEPEGAEGEEEDASEEEAGASTWRRVPPSPPSPALLVAAFLEVLEGYRDHVAVEVPGKFLDTRGRLRTLARFCAQEAAEIAAKVEARHREVLGRELGAASSLADALVACQLATAGRGIAESSSSWPWTGIGASWRAIDKELRSGVRVVQGAPPLSLALLLAVRGWIQRSGLPDLTVEQIRAALGRRKSQAPPIDCLKCPPGWLERLGAPGQRVGIWTSGPARARELETPVRGRRTVEEWWPIVDLSLRWGFRGLPGGSSLAALLAEGAS